MPVKNAPLVMLHAGNVASWMWAPQIAAFDDRPVVTPDLPGFGTRVGEDWPGLDAAADDVVAQVDALGTSGHFDLVGLSLGGAVAMRVLARHPHRVRTAFITSAIAVPPPAGLKAVSRLQLALWPRAAFWRAQAAALRLPADSRSRFVQHGLTVRQETADAMTADILHGGLPAGIVSFTGPLLVVGGEKDYRAVRKSLFVIKNAVPQGHARLAPGMHHAWNIEDPELFNDVLRQWLGGTVSDRLLEVPARLR